jgi:CheY-like chemotaxis protein/HPt (histidine-containing phosphotransfer) domain-containing protein
VETNTQPATRNTDHGLRTKDHELTLHFAIRDTGIGIPADHLDRLFQPFSQGDASITRKYGGTGLGLVISRRLVEMMGGTLEVESTPEHGSTFHFTLPAQTLTEPAILPPPHPPPTVAVAADPARRLRILLAEDNLVNQKLALALLDSLGYQADVVGNGREAVEAVGRATYDLVLMDMQMPEMDGLEATRQIRRRSPDATRPRIVAITANAMPGDREACLAAGMDDYLSKPIQIPDLAGALARWGGAASAPGPPAPEPAPLADPAADAALPTLDPARLAVLRAVPTSDGGGILPILAGIFIEEMPRQIQTLREGLAHNDPARLCHTAHSLKGMAGTLGLAELARLCSRLEARGRAGSLDGTADLVGAIAAEAARALAALDRHLTAPPV